MSASRLLLQCTLRGARNLRATGHPILAAQALQGTIGDGLLITDCHPLGRTVLGMGATRGFRLTSLLNVNVEVGSMGESITEGTIASIAKQPGDAVAADEVLFQIETDKVTIDVRAPESGVLEDLMVKEDDNVTVGQVIAKINAGDAAPAGQPASAPPAEPKQEEEAAAPAAAAPPAKPDAPATAAGPPPRQPSIKFPPRRTPDGQRISMLAAKEQQKYLAPAGLEAQPAPEQPRTAPAPPKQQQERHAQSMFGSSTWYAGRERGTKLSQSRVLTEREMELIELGGAPA